MHYLDPGKYTWTISEYAKQVGARTPSMNERVQFTTEARNARVSIPEFLGAWKTRFALPAAKPPTALDEHNLVQDIQVFCARLAAIDKAIEREPKLSLARKGLTGLHDDLMGLQVSAVMDLESLGNLPMVGLTKGFRSKPQIQDRESVHKMADYLRDNARKAGIAL